MSALDEIPMLRPMLMVRRFLLLCGTLSQAHRLPAMPIAHYPREPPGHGHVPASFLVFVPLKRCPAWRARLLWKTANATHVDCATLTLIPFIGRRQWCGL